MDFFRFPRTPHLAWLGTKAPRDDKVLSPAEREDFLDGEVIVEEKVDGANLGLSVGEDGRVLTQNRGAYLSPDACHGQFRPLFRWLEPRRRDLARMLGIDRILFGEWCHAVHGLRYDALPDWFLAFDVYDRRTRQFWSSDRRDELVRRLGLETVPRLAVGTFDLASLTRLLGPSRLGAASAEGVYIRKEDRDRLVARAKLVRPEFAAGMEEHWSRRPLSANALAPNSRSGE